MHIKRLALDWLTQLDDPAPEEWAIVEPLLSHPQLQWGACSLLGRTVPWFDLLDRLGILARLMDSPDAELVDRCFYGICCREVLAQRSTEVASLLHPYRAQDAGWRKRFQEFLRSCDLHHSRKLFDLALELLGEGLFDDAGDLTWYALTRLAERRADWAVEFLHRLLERLIHQSDARGESNPFTDRQHRDQGMVQFVRTAAANAPVDFAERIVPIIRQLALANAKAAPRWGFNDRIWPVVSGGKEYDTPKALLGSARRALQSLACSDPRRCEALLSGWENSNHKTLLILLVSAWLANPAYFAEAAAAFLINNPAALDPHFDVGTDGDEHDLGITLPLLRAISPVLSDATYAKVESVIHRYVTPTERKHPEYRGSRELSLWQQLPPDRLSRTAKMRIEELRRKFRIRKLSSFEKRMATERRKAGFVPPPIPEHAFPNMTDDHWIRAFRRYDSDRAEPRVGHFIGGALELAGPIRQAAKANRKRFATLLLKLPDDILPTYFDAILQGLIEESREVPPSAADGQSNVKGTNDDAPLPTGLLVEALERTHCLPGRPCGRSICWTARAVAARPLPEKLIELVAHYAIHDPDPENEDCSQESQAGIGPYGGDPVSAGINSVRGGAASAIARFLFEHPDLADQLLPLVESLARDRLVAVRAANLEGLLALLNTHRDTAIDLFLETCEGAEPLWATRLVEDFLYYATFTHYSRVRPLLHRMLSASEAETRLSTGRQITLATFRHPDAQEDLCLVLRGDEECRRAAAEIYSANVHHPSVREICARHLSTLFNDPSKRVREAAKDWLRERTGEWTDWQRNLLAAFVQSVGFPDAGAECALGFERTPGPLPPEFLAYVERALIVFEEQCRTSPPYALGIAYGLPALLIRFYQQTKDSAVRTHCLDLLDRMLGLGWGEAAAELGKVDR